MAIAAAAGGPGWTDIMTAFGTVGATVGAFVAVVVALRSERRADARIKAEHERADRLLAEERERSTTTVAEERRLALEREQLAQASAVRVQLASKRAPGQSPGNTRFRQLAAFIENRGAYAITAVEAAFWLGPDGPYIDAQSSERVSASPEVARLRDGFEASAELLREEVLTPWDTGIRFESPVLPAEKQAGSYVLARWTDRWGTRWEHRPGLLRPVQDDDPWGS
jgi:hypothetical protein